MDVLDKAMIKVQKEFPHVEYEKYTGINHAEVMNVLRDARMLVIPSVSEVSPNLALEAISIGVPVLLTRDCGLREVLWYSVIWIDSLDERDIYSQIKLLMNDETYTRAKEKARAFASERTYKELVQEFLNE